jgi:polysaccharide export outer membrane protein
MRPSRLLFLVLLAAASAGCAHAPVPQGDAVPVSELDVLTYGGGGKAARVAVAVPEASLHYVPAAVVEPPYTLDAGDKLRIVVFGQDGLTNSYTVSASGSITMPLIGSVRARGLTPTALSSMIADKLKQGYVREPHVAVEIEAYRPFFILGEVTAPGQYPYVPNLTVETAVAIAGGFTPRGFNRTVTLSRHWQGQTLRSTVPLTTPVRPGDTITVEERWF